MSNLAAVAIITVFLNGVEVPLTTPAFADQGRALVPVREVFERMGAVVKWEGAEKRVRLSARNRWVALPVGGKTAIANGKEVPVAATARFIGDALFVPLRPAATELGAGLAWDPGAKAVFIAFDDPREPVQATIGDIVKKPKDYDGKPVRLRGEYLGWSGSGLDRATSQKPVTRNDWVLRDATGEIYCAAGGAARSDVALQPMSSYGRRLEVVGTVQISRWDFPYIRPQTITAVQGLEGLTCTVRTDKRAYEPGEQVRFELRLANPFEEVVQLVFPSGQRYDFVVRNEEGQEVWRWSVGRFFTMAIGTEQLAPDEPRTHEEAWDQRPSEGLAAVEVPGRYRVTGEVIKQVKSYPHPFLLRERGPEGG
ncbi:MAG: BsuPI-related putative proteinase inhibitor [Armatimonadota bacterium]